MTVRRLSLTVLAYSLTHYLEVRTTLTAAFFLLCLFVSLYTGLNNLSSDVGLVSLHVLG